jgi:hypothetical protein
MVNSPLDRIRTKFTPPEVARRWGVDAAKVIAWIRSGELRAIDAATRRGGRPRYLIDAVAIADFEALRATVPPAPRAVRRRRSRPAEVVEFFGPNGEILRTI